MQRLFEPGEIVRFKLLGPPHGRGRVPAQARIYHQFRVVADAVTGGTDLGQIALFALTHRSPAELDGPIGLPDKFSANAFRLSRRIAKEDRRIGPELLAKRAAEQLV